MSEFILGQPVVIDAHLHRTHEERICIPFAGYRASQHWRVWRPQRYAGPVAGIVIGVRTLMNVERMWLGEGEGWDNNLSTAERFQAVWVATALHRKPEFALPEHVHPWGDLL